nr:MAG TPA: hypothetical protein [Caudoviricetes sp.]
MEQLSNVCIVKKDFTQFTFWMCYILYKEKSEQKQYSQLKAFIL